MECKLDKYTLTGILYEKDGYLELNVYKCKRTGKQIILLENYEGLYNYLELKYLNMNLFDYYDIIGGDKTYIYLER